jgi:lipopolysaccharide/colanic/teichoic acid biosynthesis glycosyltransferase
MWMNLAHRVPVELMDDRWVLDTFDRLDRPMVRELKRVFDLFVSGLGLVILLTLTPLLFFLVRLESPGPFLFRQVRVGQGGRPFRICKIRTMVDQPAGEARWTGTDDVRTTRVGRILRRFRMDELPQLINVLRGEMSLVGPRPEQPEIVAQLRRKISYYDYRHLVKPGITGWAQIHQGYAASVEESALKLAYDLYYVCRHSLALDLDILLRTLYVMVARIGSR